MPSTNKTDFLGLNQYIGTDQQKREDYNSDMLKIDQAFGDVETLEIGDVVTETLSPGDNATAEINQTGNVLNFNFGLPPGANGRDGDDGAPGQDGERGQDGTAATIEVGTVTTGEPGTDAEIVNVGSETAAIFNFKLPRGDKGATGEKGKDGTGVKIIGTLDNPSQLPPTAELGDAYMIDGELWVYGGDGWVNAGSIQGPPGADGEPGSDGRDGIDGADGQDGKSAYQVAVDNGFVGTETEWLESLKGADGQDGQQGSAGEKGEKGDKGDKGDTGPAGADGRDGLTTSVNDVEQIDGKITLTVANIPGATSGDDLTAALTTHNTSPDAHPTKFAAKADKSSSLQFDLTADGWTDGEQTVTLTSVSANGVVAVATVATSEQVEALRNALVRLTDQTETTVSFAADGEIPTVDIPMNLINLG